ncbi:cytochrome P450 [Imleria badia]|nr:cytochrome P450 [Imleria badia]
MSLDVLSSTTRTLSKVLDTVLTYLHPYLLHAGIACAAIWTLLRWLRTSERKFCTTQLRGPPSESFLYGVAKRILDADDSSATYEGWAQEYGLVYTAPSVLGGKKSTCAIPRRSHIFIPRKRRHIFSHRSPKKYWPFSCDIIDDVRVVHEADAWIEIGNGGLLAVHGEDHKRKRRVLTPAFSVAAIRELTSIFYDSAYKAKGAWDVLIESSGEGGAVIEVQSWMNHISLDTIGLAVFSHSFGALEGKHTSVTAVFDTFSASPRSAFNKGLMLLGQVFPFLMWVPTPRIKLIQELSVAMEEISNVLLARTVRELDMGVVGGKEERSIIGLLRANGDSEFHLTKDEVIAQMKVLLLAGYETTAITLTWALLELLRNPDMQTKLRDELLEHGADPTYDQLSNGLPYLDAVVHEILRAHSPVVEFTRVVPPSEASEDDVVPLSEPVRTKSGKLVDSLTIASMNRSAAISRWGEDAKVFRPNRWLEDADGQNGIPAKAKEIQGHRHLLTFADGPRTCLGKNFAETEFKAVLTVLVKNYVFELRDGIDFKIEIGRGGVHVTFACATIRWLRLERQVRQGR